MDANRELFAQADGRRNAASWLDGCGRDWIYGGQIFGKDTVTRLPVHSRGAGGGMPVPDSAPLPPASAGLLSDMWVFNGDAHAPAWWQIAPDRPQIGSNG